MSYMTSLIEQGMQKTPGLSSFRRFDDCRPFHDGVMC